MVHDAVRKWAACKALQRLHLQFAFMAIALLPITFTAITNMGEREQLLASVR